MDEIKDPKQDASQTEDPSAKEKESTSKKETPTFTKESQEAAVTKAVSDALSKAGRTATDFEKRDVAIKAKEERQEEDHRKRVEAARLEAKDDTEQLSAIDKQERERERTKALDDREAAVKKSEESNKEALEEIKILNRTKLAAEVAMDKRYEGVSVDAILKLTKEDTREAMEVTAKLLSEKKPPLKIDSGKNLGGTGLTEQERLDARYPTMAKK